MGGGVGLKAEGGRERRKKKEKKKDLCAHEAESF